jgi:hypothetical protein
MSKGDPIRSDSIDCTLLERAGVAIWLGDGCSVELVRRYPLLSPVQLQYLELVIVDTGNVTDVPCGNVR